MTVIEQLNSLDDEDFAELVKDEARGRAPAEAAKALRSPVLARRWYLALMKMLVSVEGQLGAMTAENTAKVQRFYAERRPRLAMNEQADFATWRAGSLRFKNGVDMRLLEARELLREQNDPLVSDRLATERNEALERVNVLEKAILRHRRFSDDAASEADRRLWSLIS